MQESLQISSPSANNLSDLMFALQTAATVHAYDLQIDHDRMLADFGCLWMIARSRLHIDRMPKDEFSVKTWLRKPTSAVSLRDFSLADAEGVFGSAAQSWVLADATERKLLNLKTVPPLWELPVLQPERTELPRRVILPQTAEKKQSQCWHILPEEIDGNGHLNNVAYIRHAEALIPTGCNTLDVVFDRECFAGERLLLETAAQNGSFYVRGVKENGKDSFRACFRKEEL